MKKNQLLAGAVLLSLAGWNGVAGADVYELAPVTVTASLAYSAANWHIGILTH